MGQLSARSIRTFVLRQGRLTEGQQRSLDQYWSVFGIDTGHVDIGGAERDFDDGDWYWQRRCTGHDGAAES